MQLSTSVEVQNTESLQSNDDVYFPKWRPIDLVSDIAQRVGHGHTTQDT